MPIHSGKNYFCQTKKENTMSLGFASVTPDQAGEAIIDLAWPMRQTVMLLGGVGIGKTSVIREVANKIAREETGKVAVDAKVRRPEPGEFFVQIWNCSGFEPWDFAAPHVSADGYTQKVISDLPGSDDSWPDHDEIRGIVVFDEVAKNPDLFKIFSQLCNERILGTGYRVPPGVLFIGTGNRVEDDAGARPLDNDLINRSMILKVETSLEAFIRHESENLHPIVLSCCKFFEPKQFLYAASAGDNEPFATPRSVRRLSDMMSVPTFNWSNVSHRHAVRGLVGTLAASVVASVMEVGNKLSRLEAWLENPSGHKQEIQEFFSSESNNVATKVYLVGFLAKYCKKDASHYGKCSELLGIVGDKEISRTFTAFAIMQNPEVRKQPGVAKHVQENGEFYS